MILANYTPDDIEYIYGGIYGTVKSGQIREVEDAAGRHILNKFDRRGLQQLQFGDNPDEKMKIGMKTWKDFWIRQITIFNQDNERRMNTNREYVDPTDQLKEHAEKLGINLIGPWSMKETDNSLVSSLKDENFQLKTQLNAVTEQVKALVDAMQARGDIPTVLRTAAEKVELSNRGETVTPEPEKDPEQDQDAKDLEEQRAIINEFQMLNREKFGDWVMMNLDRLQSPDFPSAIRAIVKEKWERLIKGDFPIPE